MFGDKTEVLHTYLSVQGSRNMLLSILAVVAARRVRRRRTLLIPLAAFEASGQPKAWSPWGWALRKIASRSSYMQIPKTPIPAPMQLALRQSSAEEHIIPVDPLLHDPSTEPAMIFTHFHDAGQLLSSLQRLVRQIRALFGTYPSLHTAPYSPVGHEPSCAHGGKL